MAAVLIAAFSSPLCCLARIARMSSYRHLCDCIVLPTTALTEATPCLSPLSPLHGIWSTSWPISSDAVDQSPSSGTCTTSHPRIARASRPAPPCSPPLWPTHLDALDASPKSQYTPLLHHLPVIYPDAHCPPCDSLPAQPNCTSIAPTFTEQTRGHANLHEWNGAEDPNDSGQMEHYSAAGRYREELVEQPEGILVMCVRQGWDVPLCAVDRAWCLILVFPHCRQERMLGCTTYGADTCEFGGGRDRLILMLQKLSPRGVPVWHMRLGKCSCKIQGIRGSGMRGSFGIEERVKWPVSGLLDALWMGDMCSRGGACELLRLEATS
ncbi:hypothetical protein B0H10DRAFT_1955431 [Mycena sp. CBHHK59/15]|nr:hypothetical protein B0H10DRAFT_1955431 [Mycena sp. CBHHK59/15]